MLGIKPEGTSTLSGLVPTARAIESLGEIEQGEWDLLVTPGLVPSSTAPHLFVLASGGWFDRAHEVSPTANKTFTYLVREERSLATEFAIPKDLPPGVRAMVSSELLPAVTAEEEHKCIIERLQLPMGGPGDSGRFSMPGSRPPGFKPFLRTADGGLIAGAFRRRGDLAECWALHGSAELAKWLPLALRAWSTVAPDRFPEPDPWADRAEWRTAAEERAHDEWRELRQEGLRYIEHWEREVGKKAEALQAERARADLGQRRLLTAQGSDLVDVVKGCLMVFGFQVDDMDDVLPPTDRREDLRVSCPDDPEWVALVEVRGYKGGAAVNDLLRLGRFARRFIQDEGRPPSRVWYVANQNVGRDPALRQPILASNPDELATFAEDDGLALDTTTLFRLWVAVESGELGALGARRLLMDSRGRIDGVA